MDWFWTKQQPKIGYVYFITTESQLEKDEITVKIGFAVNPERRIKQLQTGNEHRLVMLGKIPSVKYKELEKQLHKRFKNRRQRGEWFQLHRYEVDNILLAFSFAFDFEESPLKEQLSIVPSSSNSMLFGALHFFAEFFYHSEH
jgi:hypothetical protein